jgi:hypothetical protein
VTVTETLPTNDAGTQKRRSTRIVQAVPITVTGVDALGQPFKERTTTVMVNCHGCKYQSKHYVPKNSMVTLEVPRPEAGQKRTTQGRVVWVQRPRTVRELFQIGLEFEVAGNVWGIAFPPEDWAAAADDTAYAMPPPPDAITTPEPKLSVAPQPPAAPAAEAPKPPSPPAAPTTKPAPAAPKSVAPPTASAPRPVPPAPAAPSSDAKIHAVPSPAPDSQAAIAHQMAELVAAAKENLDKTLRKGAEAAITEEMVVARQQLDAQLHETVEKAIKVSMERVSESAVKKVVQQAAERTAAIVEEARKTTENSAINLDEKVRQAVQQAVGQAAEQAAQKAAEQAAAFDLKRDVEDAVNRALREREASTPSLEILSSPEAAQQHLDQWKKSLEETAQTVRSQTIEQSQAEAASAAQRWNEQFEQALQSASQNLGAKLSEASQAALNQAEQDILARSQGLRGSLDEAIAGAAATIEALGSGLRQERDRAEEAKAQLSEAAKTTLDQTRQRLDELLASQHEEIARKADQVLA